MRLAGLLVWWIASAGWAAADPVHTRCPYDPEGERASAPRHYFGMMGARSVLGPRAVTVAGEYDRRLQDGRARESLHGLELTMRLGEGRFHASAGVSAWHHYKHLQDGSDEVIDDYSYPPRITLGIGARRLGTWLGGNLRYGYGVRVNTGLLGYRIEEEDPTRHPPAPGPVAELRPFDYLQSAYGTPAAATAEARIELVGCYAPFIHFTAGLRGVNGRMPESLDAPVSVMIGAYPHRRVGVTTEVTVLWTRYPSYDSPSRSGFVRLRFAGEILAIDRLRPGLALDQIIGDELDGLFFHLYLQVLL
jgi:hypothetical protein